MEQKARTACGACQIGVAHVVAVHFSLLQPMAVLASVVISGVISLFDYPEALYLWRVHKFDFGVWMLAFVGTLFLGVEIGLGIAVIISLLLVIFESAYPHTAVLGRLPGTHQYRNIKQYPYAECYDGIVMVRIDAPIYFANTQTVREKIQKYHERAQEEIAARTDQEGSSSSSSSVAVRYIILELSPVSHIDTSALHVLQDMNKTYQKNQQIQLCLANPNPRVMHRLVVSGLADDIGREHIFVSLHDAVYHCLQEMDAVEQRSLSSQEALLPPADIDGFLPDVEKANDSSGEDLPQTRDVSLEDDQADDIEIALVKTDGSQVVKC